MPDKLPGELGVAVVQEPCCRDGIRLFVALSQSWVVSLDSVYGGKRSFDAHLADCGVQCGCGWIGKSIARGRRSEVELPHRQAGLRRR
jgi:hypothetical protein